MHEWLLEQQLKINELQTIILQQQTTTTIIHHNIFRWSVVEQRVNNKTKTDGNVIIDELGQFTHEKYSIFSVIQGEAVQEMNTPLYNIYPNPVDNILTIKGDDMRQVNVFNAVGQIVRCVNCNSNELRLDVADLNNGIYFINVTNDKGEMTSNKVSIQH